MAAARPILTWVLDEHFDELEALWERRDQLIFDLDWTLEDLHEHELRFRGHLKGLKVGGAATLERAQAMLAEDDRYRALAATLAILQSDDLAAHDVLLPLLDSPDGEAGQGVRLALRHAALPEAVAAALGDAAERGDGPRRTAAIDVLSFRRALSPNAALPAPDPAEPEASALRLAAFARTRVACPQERLEACLASDAQRLPSPSPDRTRPVSRYTASGRAASQGSIPAGRMPAGPW